MTTIENIRFNNNLGRPLAGRVYRPEHPGVSGIIFSHGLFSTKDGYKITRLAQDIIATGHSLMVFDFSSCGESGGDIADLSVLQEVEDLAAAVEFFRGSGIDKIHLMGSSMGAAVTLLYAARENAAVVSLILIATPADFRDMFPGNEGVTGGAPQSENGMTAIDGFRIKNSFFREIAGIDMRDALRKIRVPVLAFHGGMDGVVDPRNTGILEDELTTFVKTVVIDDGDHNLTREEDIRLMKETISGWLTENFDASGGWAGGKEI
jgi:pimeloyl-ACP methyl ester carboxylesterase